MIEHEHEPTRQELYERALRDLQIQEYQSAVAEVSEWVESVEHLPESFRKQLPEVTTTTSVYDVLLALRTTLQSEVADKNRPADSFDESRFSSVDTILEQGIISCGTLARTFGVGLRDVGIPVRFVDGMHHLEDGSDRKSVV